MKYKIISIQVEHIESFRQAVGSVAREKQYLAFLDTPSYDTSKTFVLSNIREQWPQVVVIVNDKVIGWCDIASLNRPVCTHSGTLGIGVVKEYRDKGLGKQLMSKALELAKDKGLTRIELTVREDNIRAIEMYKKFRFEVEGILRKSILIDGNYYNEIFMALLF